MKKHINFWIVMFLAVSLVLPVYSMAQVTPTKLTLEDSTGNRISTPAIKSFAMGTDNNLVIFLDQAFNFTDLIPDISLASCTTCSIAGPAAVTATQGASLSFNVQSTDTSAVISLVASSYEIGPRTLTSTSGSAPFSWSTGSTPTGSYLAVFQALDGDQKSQLPVMINVVPPGYTLTINATNGSVTKYPDQATYTISPVQTVQLTPVPASGYYFTSWSGDLSGTANPASIQMNASKTVTASFAVTPPQTYTLNVSASGPGTVGKNPDKTSYNAGESVQLTATQSSGATFTGWSGDLTGSTNPATITMNSNKTITATFTQQNTTDCQSGDLLSTPRYPTNSRDQTGPGTWHFCIPANSPALLVQAVGGTNETNAILTWTFPDGRTFQGPIVGAGQTSMKLRLWGQNTPAPSIPDQYIPQGRHTLTISGIFSGVWSAEF